MLGGWGCWVDSLVQPLVFIPANALAGFEIALWGALRVTFIIGIFGLFKGQQIRYVLWVVAGYSLR